MVQLRFFCSFIVLTIISTVAIASHAAPSSGVKAQASPAPTATPGASSEGYIMGFQSWKATRVEQARLVLERIQQDLQIEQTPTAERTAALKATGPNTESSPQPPQRSSRISRADDQRLQQARLNLEIAQEFGINDYYLLYLSQFKNKSAFVEAARKLSPEEIADLMYSFRRPIGVSDSTEVPPPSILSELGVPSPKGSPARDGI